MQYQSYILRIYLGPTPFQPLPLLTTVNWGATPFDGDVVYWTNRMNKKYDGIHRNLIKSQDTKCPMCNLRLRVTDEIHVHHVNHDHSDNRWQNPQVVHRACHQIHHRL